MKVRIGYVDGSVIEVDPSVWTTVKAEGVDWVEVDNGGKVKIASASVYWLYPEKNAFVAGWGSLRYDPNPLTEIVCYSDGTQEERRPSYLPDLQHSQVKLGWWWPGKPRPAYG